MEKKSYYIYCYILFLQLFDEFQYVYDLQWNT